MALTRKSLKAMGLTDEQIDSIVEMHTETVDGLKDQIKTYKADAESLPGVQKELDDLKAAGDGGYKEKYEKEHNAFEDYKNGVTAKESRAAKEKAVRTYLESKNIQGGNLTIAMRGLGAEIDAAELDGNNLKDTKVFDDLIAGDFAGLVSTTRMEGANTSTPPENNSGKTRADILKMPYADRAKLYQESPETFNEIMKG